MLQSEDNSRGALARVADAGLEDILTVSGSVFDLGSGFGQGMDALSIGGSAAPPAYAPVAHDGMIPTLLVTCVNAARQSLHRWAHHQWRLQLGTHRTGAAHGADRDRCRELRGGCEQGRGGGGGTAVGSCAECDSRVPPASRCLHL